MNNRNIIACIPARLGSSRLKHKLTLDIGGKPIIQHVYERAVATKLFSNVYIAVDDAMYNFVTFTENKILTGDNHKSGSSRICEAVKDIDCDYVVNIQGDEPFLNKNMLSTLLDGLDNVDIATLCFKMNTSAHVFDVNKVKITKDVNDNALYFSRSPIPYLRNTPREEWVDHADYFEHIGIYAFRKEVLTSLYPGKRTMLESSESLEQLNWLFNGYKIKCLETTETSISIDTKEDLEFARAYLNK